ncbi:tig, partial [Symbiodinium microadriaticum]
MRRNLHGTRQDGWNDWNGWTEKNMRSSVCVIIQDDHVKDSGKLSSTDLLTGCKGLKDAWGATKMEVLYPSAAGQWIHRKDVILLLQVSAPSRAVSDLGPWERVWAKASNAAMSDGRDCSNVDVDIYRGAHLDEQTKYMAALATSWGLSVLLKRWERLQEQAKIYHALRCSAVLKRCLSAAVFWTFAKLCEPGARVLQLDEPTTYMAAVWPGTEGCFLTAYRGRSAVGFVHENSLISALAGRMAVQAASLYNGRVLRRLRRHIPEHACEAVVVADELPPANPAPAAEANAALTA